MPKIWLQSRCDGESQQAKKGLHYTINIFIFYDINDADDVNSDDDVYNDNNSCADDRSRLVDALRQSSRLQRLPGLRSILGLKGGVKTEAYQLASKLKNYVF